MDPVATPLHYEWLDQGVYSQLADPVKPLRLTPIDFGNFANDQSAVGEQLVKSLKEHGFAVLINHGLNTANVATGFQLAKQVFDLPVREKVSLQRTDAPSARR